MASGLTILTATTALCLCCVGVAGAAGRDGKDAPAYGRFGFDEAGMDRAARAGDNFYRYANGGWEKATPIPADRSNYGAFTVLDELSFTRTRVILEDAAKAPGTKIGDLYASFMDEAEAERKGLDPVRPRLAALKALPDAAGFARALGAGTRDGIAGPIGIYVNQDDKAPDRYALIVTQAGLGLPDRDYYLSDDAELAKALAAYEAHLTTMLTLAGEGDAAARAHAVVAFEKELAAVHWTRADSRDADRTYNSLTWDQLKALAPGFDWDGWAAGLGHKPDSVIVAQPSAITGTAALIGRTPLAVLRDYATARELDAAAPYLSAAFVDADFAFNGTVLSGTPQNPERWKRGVDLVKAAMGEAVGERYVALHFPPETKQAADALVKNIIAAFDRRLQGLAWMAPETRARAREKLAAFRPKIGYPDRWRDYSALEIRRDDLYGNVLAANRFEFDRNMAKLGQPVDRDEWFMTPMEVNAYANPTMNEIVFPAAILQPPFFDPKADPAVNYGGIGAVIGHEISHHFDDQGRKYDKNGKLAEWWTAEDVTRFTALADGLVRQYDAYQPLPGLNVQGRLTLGENIADLVGLTVAHDAYLMALDGKPAPVIDGFTGDQRFYLGWAQVWRRSYRPENLRQRLLTDPHSPSEQRAAVVRNLDPWYPAFKVRDGQTLFLAPGQRVRIW